MTYRDRHPGDDVELLVDGGVEYKLRLSKSNKKGGGYMNVVNVRDKGEYHVKIKVAGGGQQMLPGKACTTPQEAALRYAKFLANPHAIVKKDPFRAKKGEGKVCAPPCPARVWCSHPHLFSAPFSQKRQRRVAQAKAQAEVPLCTSWPPWVVCNQSYNLWLSGVELPSELQLSVGHGGDACPGAGHQGCCGARASVARQCHGEHVELYMPNKVSFVEDTDRRYGLPKIRPKIRPCSQPHWGC